MNISANVVKELRERTGAGMMECKAALVETGGDIESAIELLRTRGQAKADKKASRVAAEGRIEVAVVPSGTAGVVAEINCETDFVARDENFVNFAREVARLALERRPADPAALMALVVADGRTLEQVRTELISKIGENINVRRFEIVTAAGQLGSYVHGSRIGVLVDVTGGDDELRRDLAMHVAAASPQWVGAAEVPADILQRERRILAEQAGQEGKPAEIVAKMVEGRLRKYLAEITLTGQPFVKDPDTTVASLLKNRGATVARFIRMQVGEGIEKKTANFADEVRAQLQSHG